MPQVIKFDVDIVGALTALRVAPREIQAQTKRELVALAKDVVTEARAEMPSGMSKGKYGYTWDFWGTKGVVMSALGNDAAKGPKSWAGALEGGPGGDQGFRHPVYPKKGSDPAKWAWGPKKSTQPPDPLLHKAWAKARATVVPKMEAVVQLALKAAGLSE